MECVGCIGSVSSLRSLLAILSQQFSVDIAGKASNVCLAHLFTYQDFDEGTLGLAYVAPSKADIAGGLCSKGESRGSAPRVTGRWRWKCDSRCCLLPPQLVLRP